LKLGIRSLVWKTDPASDLLSAVRAVQRNRLYFTKTVDDLVLRGYFGAGSRTAPVDNDEELTLREREVTQLIVEGRSTKEVAVTLNISVKTAETHRQNVMAKLGLHSLVQLTRYAIENGILPSLRRGSLLDISSDRQLQPGPSSCNSPKKSQKLMLHDQPRKFPLSSAVFIG
jgi:DNA-binding NarL/FixJ family response regulator